MQFIWSCRWEFYCINNPFNHEIWIRLVCYKNNMITKTGFNGFLYLSYVSFKTCFFKFFNHHSFSKPTKIPTSFCRSRITRKLFGHFTKICTFHYFIINFFSFGKIFFRSWFIIYQYMWCSDKSFLWRNYFQQMKKCVTLLRFNRSDNIIHFCIFQFSDCFIRQTAQAGCINWVWYFRINLSIRFKTSSVIFCKVTDVFEICNN